MDSSHQLPLRCARNRLIDLLGLGDCHPLTDLAVTVEPPKVTFGGAAQVAIAPAQAGVRYQLLGPDGALLGQADGPADVLHIATPPVLENITFRIRTRKPVAPAGLPLLAAQALDTPAAVKVGLDTGLLLRWRDDPALALLDPALTDPQPSDPRLADCGSSFWVEIDKSQEGVDYALLIDGRPGPDTVRGDRSTVALATGALREDAVIQVQATKHFALADKDSERQVLAARLLLKLRADPARALRADGPAVIDHGQAGAVQIAASQPGAHYQAFVRPIADADYLREVQAAGTDRVAVAVDGAADVQVAAPVRSSGWAVPDGFVPVPGGPLAGTGGDLRIALPAQARDHLVIVQAIKHHASGGAATLPSAQWLAQVAMLLLRPDPARALRLRLSLNGHVTGDAVQVSGGQPSVRYHLLPLPDGPAPPWPAYVHQRDATDAALNKGLGQLVMEVDFIVSSASGQAGDASDAGDAARQPPPDPVLLIAPLPVGSRLAIRAVKAQTGVATPMATEVLIAAGPKVQADPPEIEAGQPAHIRLTGIDPLDRYQLLRDGQAVDADLLPQPDGLLLSTGPLSADTRFTLLARRGADDALQVERLLTVAVRVRPVEAKPADPAPAPPAPAAPPAPPPAG